MLEVRDDLLERQLGLEGDVRRLGSRAGADDVEAHVRRELRGRREALVVEERRDAGEHRGRACAVRRLGRPLERRLVDPWWVHLDRPVRREDAGDLARRDADEVEERKRAGLGLEDERVHAERTQVVRRPIDEPRARREPADPLDEQQRRGALEDDEIRLAKHVFERAEGHTRVAREQRRGQPVRQPEPQVPRMRRRQQHEARQALFHLNEPIGLLAHGIREAVVPSQP